MNASFHSPVLEDTSPADDRSAQILALVRRHGLQSIEALARHFGVTSQTIRRHANHLCAKGLCRRVHGGIDVPAAPTDNLAYQQRQVLQLQAKRRIAARLAQEVPDGASLFFGIGTTPAECARALAARPGLRVMTNNLNVALALSASPSCEITIAGGRLRNQDRDVIAGEAHGFFERFSVDIGIYGVGGVSDDGQLLDFNDDEVVMRRAIAGHCRRRFLVLDHSKFGRSATVRGGHITEASAVFTDQAVPSSIQVLLDAAAVPVVVAEAAVAAVSLEHPPVGAT